MGETHRGPDRSTTSCPGKNKRRRKDSPLPLQVVRDKRPVTLTPLESMGRGGNIFLSARKEGRRWRSKTLQMPAGKTVSAKKKYLPFVAFFFPSFALQCLLRLFSRKRRWEGRKTLLLFSLDRKWGRRRRRRNSPPQFPSPPLPVFTHGY